jgi:hypothetical protein
MPSGAGHYYDSRPRPGEHAVLPVDRFSGLLELPLGGPV